MKRDRFLHQLRKVTVIHLAILLLLSVATWLKAYVRRRPEMSMPIEFVVEVPTAPQAQEAPARPRDMTAPARKPKPEPKPARDKKKIDVSRKVVTRSESDKPRDSKLSPEEIQRLLDRGAKPSDHTNIPSEDARCLALIQNRLFALWSQPSYAEAGDTSVEIILELGPAGVVKSGRLSKASGNPVMDASVQHVIGAISRIEGLTASFLQRHSEVTIAFKVDR